MWLTRVSVQNPVFAAMMMFALMVVGLFAYKDVGVEEFPNVEFPFVIVTTNYPGASPEVVESDVTRKIEDTVNTISGVKRVISTSYEGRSFVAIEFYLNVPVSVAVQDVRDKIAVLKTEFRDEIKDPIIERYNPGSVPVVSLAFTSNTLPLRELSTYIDQKLSKRLQTVSGVGKVEILGEVKREIRVYLKPQALQAYSIGVDEVLRVLAAENAELPSGTLKAGNQEQVVQIKGRIAQPEQFKRLIVARRQGQPIYLEQVADVLDGEQDLESAALINGQAAVSVDVIKSSGANVIEVVDKVNDVLAEIRPQLPAGVSMTVVADSSKSIRASLADVEKTLLEGAALAILIVLLFLGSWRSTVITGLTLPISLLGTIFAIYYFGFTINLMSLMALSLCIGLLVDDAIVVRENIVRHAAMGKNHYQAALDGTNEIGLAVLATTLSIIAVFLPVAFMGGIIGRFFYQFGVTVSAAVLLSMFVSFTLDPMLSSVWPDKHKHGEKRTGFGGLLDKFGLFLDWLGEVYARVIAWSLRHRRITMGIAVASLIGAFSLAGLIGKEFVPEPDLSEIGVSFETAQDASLEYTLSKVHQAEAIIRHYPEVISTYATVNTSADPGRNQASIRVLLKPKQQRQLSQKQLINIIRARLTQVAGISITSVAAAKESVSGGLKPIMLSVQGPDLKELQRISQEIAAGMGKIEGLVDIESSLKASKPTIAVNIDREAASDAGLSVASIGNALRPLLAGDEVTTWQDSQGENYDVRVRLPESERQDLENLSQLYLASTKKNPITDAPYMIPLGQVATFEASEGAAQINRRNLMREVLIQANTDGRPAGDIGVDVKKLQDSIKLPAGYRFETEGANKDMAESAGYAMTALLLAVIFIYMVLGSQFNSFLYPVAIMTSLPLSLIGVFLALFIFNSTLNLFSIIGVVMLMGLVTKNAILLIDFIKVALEKGEDRTRAVIMAGKTRLRPILMTTMAMVMGMLPLALGLGDGAEQRAPMAHAIIGGVITSTLLTLVVVPVVYTYLDDIKQRCARLFASKSAD
ncbi:efflux RND transporter permease subunit [Agitococcus lubricus]|uniref:HAE1 family hydrophobic/amphiphilic exporter-1 n=1 Tax=Agitococcus lubricus TaxID=1077255 RepID=A0A2T5IWV8_9GAMM|nr:efflux RND transporter permease subunit [Agitococcus lubricus]PTQ88431.1 HAE1 family hydrophobic/amphiphilic exporter-1 [Agitococcus lubricus]